MAQAKEAPRKAALNQPDPDLMKALNDLKQRADNQGPWYETRAENNYQLGSVSGVSYALNASSMPSVSYSAGSLQ